MKRCSQCSLWNDDRRGQCERCRTPFGQSDPHARLRRIFLRVLVLSLTSVAFGITTADLVTAPVAATALTIIAIGNTVGFLGVSGWFLRRSEDLVTANRLWDRLLVFAYALGILAVIHQILPALPDSLLALAGLLWVVQGVFLLGTIVLGLGIVYQSLRQRQAKPTIVRRLIVDLLMTSAYVAMLLAVSRIAQHAR